MAEHRREGVCEALWELPSALHSRTHAKFLSYGAKFLSYGGFAECRLLWLAKSVSVWRK